MGDLRMETGMIEAAPLIRKTDQKLIELLESLEPDEWDLPTIVPGWKVRDVAAHLLDTVLRKLSMVRDGCFVERVEIHPPRGIVDLVNRLNREGVTVYRRLSPAILCGLMRTACEQSADFHESLDPLGRAAFAVSWAGEAESLNWFDAARELTERWHHQQQIRLAVNRPGIMTRELYRPVLDTFARGLPHAYGEVAAAVGSRVCLDVEGECGGSWAIRREESRWVLDASEPPFAARVRMPEEIAWRVFTKGIPRAEAVAMSGIEGHGELGLRIFDLVAIVA